LPTQASDCWILIFLDISAKIGGEGRLAGDDILRVGGGAGLAER
jgi:hypothetical protein